MVDYFRQEVILCKVHTVSCFTVARNTRSAKLCHAVVVGHTDVEVCFDLRAHGRRTGFRTENAQTQGIVRKGISCFLDCFGEIERIGRSSDKTCYAVVTHHHQLLFGVARRSRDNGRTDIFHAVVQS